tara:strand:+ start:86 stop:973 length:888 start_codon:yes stop_codon:yes gene_type:complete
MKNRKTKSLLSLVIIILFFNLLTVSNAHSAAGAIAKIFAKIGQVFSKTGVKAGKGLGSGIKGSDSGLDELTKRFMKNPEEAKIIERVGIEKHTEHFNNLNSSSIGRLFRKHGVNKADNLTDLNDLIDRDISGIESNYAVFKYIVWAWRGRVFRNSEYYNKPTFDNRTLLICETNESIFYFSIIMEDKIRRAFLTDNIALVENYQVLKPQELIVTKDIDALKIMGTKPQGNKSFPNHYFVFYQNQGFVHENHIHGTENPNIVFVRAEKNVNQSNSKCFKATKQMLTIKKLDKIKSE